MPRGAAIAGGWPKARIKARQNTQAHRIYNGIRSGSISFNESQKLAQGQASEQYLENQAKSAHACNSNGRFTPAIDLRQSTTSTQA